MNWARGLFRLWLVLSVLWISAWILAMRPDKALVSYQESIRSAVEAGVQAADLEAAVAVDPNAANPFEAIQLRAIETKWRELAERRSNDLLDFIYVGPVVSVAVFAVGALLLWASRGFRRDEAK